MGMHPMSAPTTEALREAPLSRAALYWGVGGVALLLVQAVFRLTPIAMEPLRRGGLSAVEAGTYAAWVLVSLYSEGYRGFQKGFVPRVVGRAFYLARAPSPVMVVLAPFFCMSLVHARRRRLIVSWSIVLLISAAVAFVRSLPYPWRGIVDGGVVAGLAYGLASLTVTFIRALTGDVPVAELDLPIRG
jgi:hypothetical protein